MAWASQTAVMVMRRLATAVLGAVIAVAALSGVARAALLRVGPQQALPEGAVVHGPVAPAQKFHVSVTLKPRDPSALAAYAQAVSTPGSPDYHAYLTPAQFGRRFGPTEAQIRAVLRALRARGLRPGPVSPGGLSIPVSATAATLERAFSVSLTRLSLPGRRSATVGATDLTPIRSAEQS